MQWRRHAPAVALVLLAAALRLPALDWLPSPAGDEGNWTQYGFRLFRGEPAALEPNAAFVSLLFARLIAWSMRLLGPGFGAARLVNALAGVAVVALAYALLAGRGDRRGGLAIAGLLAVHPWAVAYSRITSVPYSLAMVVLLLGGLLFQRGLARNSGWDLALSVQILAVGAHFSPLTFVGPVALVGLAFLPANRWALRDWRLWASVAVAEIHVLPVVRGALRVASETPELAPFQHLGPRLGSYLHMVGTGLGGEATLRHFTNLALPPLPALVTVVPVVAVLALALGRRARSASPLGSLGPVWVACALVVTPLVLAPGREWEMPYNHMDRYLLAIMPGFFLCAASAAHARRGLLLVAGFGIWLALGGLGRLAWPYLAGHGVDHGEGVFDGGSGYRGWLVSDVSGSTMEQIRDVALRELGPDGGAILVADRVFIPLGFTMRGTRVPVHDVRRTEIPANRSGRYLFILWPDEVLSLDNPPSAPPKYVESNRYLRERLETKFARKALVGQLHQKDGFPLLEIWLAEEPLQPRLRAASGGPA